jgi:hypothetical protein
LTTLSRSFRGFTWSGASRRLGPLETTNANGKNCVTKFTPRLEMTLVGLQGKLDREIKARVRYAFDAEPDSAANIAPHSSALELRRLQALTEIGVEHNSVIIVSSPVENNATAMPAARRIDR